MIPKLIAIALVCLPLAACDWKTLDRIEGHDALGVAIPDTSISLPPEASGASSASSEPSVVETPVVEASSSSSEYVPPLTEACDVGSSQFRVWTCDSTGHRSYI